MEPNKIELWISSKRADFRYNPFKTIGSIVLLFVVIFALSLIVSAGSDVSQKMFSSSVTSTTENKGYHQSSQAPREAALNSELPVRVLVEGAISAEQGYVKFLVSRKFLNTRPSQKIDIPLEVRQFQPIHLLFNAGDNASIVIVSVEWPSRVVVPVFSYNLISRPTLRVDLGEPEVAFDLVWSKNCVMVREGFGEATLVKNHISTKLRYGGNSTIINRNDSRAGEKVCFDEIHDMKNLFGIADPVIILPD